MTWPTSVGFNCKRSAAAVTSTTSVTSPTFNRQFTWATWPICKVISVCWVEKPDIRQASW